MEQISSLIGDHLGLVIAAVIWESIWKIIALWKSARKNELGWFICIAVINTVGILPIVYIILNRNKSY